MTPTQQNTAVTVLQPLSSVFILGQVDIKQLLNCNTSRSDQRVRLKELKWWRIYSTIQRSGSGVEDWQSRVGPLSGDQKSGPRAAHRFSFPIVWRNPEGSAYRSSNVRDEAHPLRDSCCAVEPAPVWEDHQQNSAPGKHDQNPKRCYATAACIIPSPQKPYVCKDCQVFLITKS